MNIRSENGGGVLTSFCSACKWRIWELVAWSLSVFLTTPRKCPCCAQNQQACWVTRTAGGWTWQQPMSMGLTRSEQGRTWEARVLGFFVDSLTSAQPLKSTCQPRVWMERGSHHRTATWSSSEPAHSLSLRVYRDFPEQTEHTWPHKEWMRSSGSSLLWPRTLSS